MNQDDRATFAKRARNYLAVVEGQPSGGFVSVPRAQMESLQAAIRAQLCAEMANDPELSQAANSAVAQASSGTAKPNPRPRKKKKAKRNPAEVSRVVRQNTRDCFRSVYKG